MGKKHTSNELPEHDRNDRRVHVALPIRITYHDKNNKPHLEMACTYDISRHGARITSLRCVKQTGEIVAVERGRNKAACRVVWVGDADSERGGQIGLQTVEPEKRLWDAELADMEETYDPLVATPAPPKPLIGGSRNRRRHDRLKVEGAGELLKTNSSGKTGGTKVVLKDLSELGCLVTTKQVVMPGTNLKLVLKVANYDLRLKGQVRHSLDMGIGIEFSEIRKGDRQNLKHLLQKLGEKHLEASVQVDVEP